MPKIKGPIQIKKGEALPEKVFEALRECKVLTPLNPEECQVTRNQDLLKIHDNGADNGDGAV